MWRQPRISSSKSQFHITFVLNLGDGKGGGGLMGYYRARDLPESVYEAHGYSLESATQEVNFASLKLLFSILRGKGDREG